MPFLTCKKQEHNGQVIGKSSTSLRTIKRLRTTILNAFPYYVNYKALVVVFAEVKFNGPQKNSLTT